MKVSNGIDSAPMLSRCTSTTPDALSGKRSPVDCGAHDLLRVPQQMTLPFAEIAHQPGVMRYETVNRTACRADYGHFFSGIGITKLHS
jgi:hypothetical protein